MKKVAVVVQEQPEPFGLGALCEVWAEPYRPEDDNPVFDFTVVTPTPGLLRTRAGFDLVRQNFATTQLQLIKDLHCWEARLNVVPFGDFRQVGFSIYVKSGFLRDLLRLEFARGGLGTPFGGI